MGLIYESRIPNLKEATRLKEADGPELLVTLPKNPTCQEDFATSRNWLGDNLETYPVNLRAPQPR